MAVKRNTVFWSAPRLTRCKFFYCLCNVFRPLWVWRSFRIAPYFINSNAKSLWCLLPWAQNWRLPRHVAFYSLFFIFHNKKTNRWTLRVVLLQDTCAFSSKIERTHACSTEHLLSEFSETTESAALEIGIYCWVLAVARLHLTGSFCIVIRTSVTRSEPFPGHCWQFTVAFSTLLNWHRWSTLVFQAKKFNYLPFSLYEHRWMSQSPTNYDTCSVLIFLFIEHKYV